MSQRLNLLAPDVRENPYPFYAKLRREAPVSQVDPPMGPVNIWVVSRHDDVVSAFKNTQVFSSAGLRMSSEPPWLARPNPLSDSLILQDPPRHGRLRNLISRAFNTSTLNRVESHMRDTAAKLSDEMRQRRTVDFAAEYASRVPASVLAMLMGLDASLEKNFNRWANDAVSPGATAPDDHARLDQIRKSLEEMEHYLREVMERRRAAPGDDLVSQLLQARVEGEALTDKEVMGFLALLLVAGLETTMALLTHMTMVLARFPEWMDRLRQDASLIPHFIEEVLRYEPVLQGTLRLTLQETELGGVKLPAHVPVMLLVGSALHDETQFPEPERFNPERRVQSNIAFGHGPHFCLGASLGRLEARLMLEELLRRFRRIELRADKLQWNMSLNTRTPVKLPIEVFPL